MPVNTSVSSPGQIRGWLQVLAIVLLMPIGGILGAFTGFIPLSPMGSVLLPLAAATLFLRRDGRRWRDLVFGRPLGILELLVFAAMALAGVYAGVIGLAVVFSLLGLPGADYRLLQQLVEGDLAMYLWFLLPVSWGSAAIGEELVARGFLQYRLEGLAGTRVAVILQAAIFGAAHLYQGVAGMFATFVVGLVFGAVYLRCGRNLLPLILAHGTIDTIAITAMYLGLAETLSWG